MAIAIEGFSVVVLRDRADDAIDGGVEILSTTTPNGTAIMDDDLWRCSFMVMDDAMRFMEELTSAGLQVQRGPDPDAVIVSEFEETVEPYCEWLKIAKWEQGVIAWLDGTDPKTLIAREGWSPKRGSGLVYQKNRMEKLEFLRIDGNVEVYRDKETGEELYIGRTELSPEAVYQVASRVIVDNIISPGHPPITGPVADEVHKAIGDLEKLASDHSGFWRVHWCIGKGRQSLGQLEEAYTAFKVAWTLDQENEAIPRELAGACLELGRAEEAVEIGEKAASLKPDNAETLGNLACAYLVAARHDEAQKTISAALQLAPDDTVNQHLQTLIQDVAAGRIPQPHKLSDLTRRKKKTLMDRLKFW